MKKYYKPVWQIFYVKIENTLAISSASTKPESSEDVSTIWEKETIKKKIIIGNKSYCYEKHFFNA
mgnify:CR=1 FL=1